MRKSQWAVFGLLMAAAASAQTFSENYNSYQWNRYPWRERAGLPVAVEDHGDWYEWWYYKVVVPGTDEAFYFVYGVVNPWDKEHTKAGTRAVLSMGSFGDHEIWGKHYPVSAFAASYSTTDVKVGDEGHATAGHIVGKIVDPVKGEVSWDLRLKKRWGFEAMGWGTYVKGISNIYWYPVQADAVMSGEIVYKGKRIVIEDAPAYQDRNWGRSLPDWWVWICSNHFENSPGTTLALGGGRPYAFEKVSMKDAISIGFKHGGHEYVFRSSDGDRETHDIAFGRWEVTAENHRGERIEISAYAPPEKFMNLPFYSPNGEQFNDYEALKGTVRVKLYEQVPGRALGSTEWKLKADVTSHETGIEWGSYDKIPLPGEGA